MAILRPIAFDLDNGEQKEVGATDIMTCGSHDFAWSTYSAGNISVAIENDVGFSDVDVNNAKIDFNVSIPGKYWVQFLFSVNLVSDEGMAMNSSTLFRLTDGVNNSNPIFSGVDMPSLAAFQTGISQIVNIMNVFTFDSAGAKTVKLQKQNFVSTNVNSRNVLANANSPVSMVVFRISD